MKTGKPFIVTLVAVILVTLTLEASAWAESAHFYITRAILATTAEQYDQAIADLTKAIEIDPSEPLFYAGRAEVFYFKKEYDKAWEDVRKVQSLGLRDPKLQGKFQELVEELRRASGRER